MEEHLWLPAKRGYEARTFLDAIAASAPGKHLAVTFDDGYRSVFELAFPILRAAGMPATVFVPTALIGM
jgi:peptidoglycan/xylan/chitin deacetylase (PgdA/CDA1 family)